MGVFTPLAPRVGNRAAVRRARRSRKARLRVRNARCRTGDSDSLGSAVLTLLASQPTVAEVRAQALRDAATAWSDWDALQAPELWLRERADREVNR